MAFERIRGWFHSRRRTFLVGIVLGFVLFPAVGIGALSVVAGEHQKCVSPPDSETMYFDSLYKVKTIVAEYHSLTGIESDGYIYAAEAGTFDIWFYSWDSGDWDVHSANSGYGGPGIDHTFHVHGHDSETRHYFVEADREMLTIWRKPSTAIGNQSGRVVLEAEHVADCGRER